MQPLQINKGDKVKWVFYHHMEESTIVGSLGENDYSINLIAHVSFFISSNEGIVHFLLNKSYTASLSE